MTNISPASGMIATAARYSRAATRPDIVRTAAQTLPDGKNRCTKNTVATWKEDDKHFSTGNCPGTHQPGR